MLLVGSFASSPSVPTGYKQVFLDDFNSTSLDTSKWSIITGTEGHSQSHYIKNDVSVSNGNLVISTKRHCVGSATDTLSDSNDSTAPCPSGKIAVYSSGQVRTGNVFPAEGRIEIRAKLPDTQLGLWPALWMRNQTGWCNANYGELDTMEWYADYPRNNTSTSHITCSGGSTKHIQHNVQYSSDLSTSWHTWAMDWSPNGVKYYFDGTLQQSANGQGDSDKNIDSAPDFSGVSASQFSDILSEMWQLRINTQVTKDGDAWHKAPDNTKTFNNAQFLIDYVRVLVPDSSGGTTTPPADTTPPTVPTNLSAQADSSTQVSLSWVAATDDTGVTGYNVYRNGVKLATSATTSYTDTSVSAATSYSYSVSAYDAAGNTSAQTSVVTVSTPSPAPTAIPTPTNLKATPKVESVDLSWDSSSDSRVDEYSLRYIRSDSTTKSDGATWVYPGRTTTNSQTITGLTADVSYDFQIRAIDNMGTTDTTDDLKSNYTNTVTGVPTIADTGRTSDPIVETYPTTNTVDTTSPFPPNKLTYSLTYNSWRSSYQINLGWTAGTDNVAVKDYIVKKDNQQIATTSDTKYSDYNIKPGYYYTYSIQSRDTSDNVSSPIGFTTKVKCFLIWCWLE